MKDETATAATSHALTAYPQKGIHAFQKKSKKGIATPKADIQIVRQRLKVAAEHYQQMQDKNP